MSSPPQVLNSGRAPFVIAAGLPGPRGLTGPSGGEDEAVFAKRVDFADDTTIYRGEAAVGTADAQPLWRIRRITLAGDGDVTEEWAGGTAAFDKVWADHLTLGYS